MNLSETPAKETPSVASRRALQALVPSAIETLRDLLPNAKDDVRLRTATAILDRAGLSSDDSLGASSVPPETLISALTGMATAMGGSLTAALEKALLRESLREPSRESDLKRADPFRPSVDRELLLRLNDET